MKVLQVHLICHALSSLPPPHLPCLIILPGTWDRALELNWSHPDTCQRNCLLLEVSGEVGARLPGGGYAFVADQLVQAVACDLQHILLIVRWSASAGFLTFWVSYFYSNLSENTTLGLFKQNKNFPNQHNA